LERKDIGNQFVGYPSDLVLRHIEHSLILEEEDSLGVEVDHSSESRQQDDKGSEEVPPAVALFEINPQHNVPI
jgi:hypothetical protein